LARHGSQEDRATRMIHVRMEEQREGRSTIIRQRR
jgi:hypothetical protein